MPFKPCNPGNPIGPFSPGLPDQDIFHKFLSFTLKYSMNYLEDQVIRCLHAIPFQLQIRPIRRLPSRPKTSVTGSLDEINQKLDLLN